MKRALVVVCLLGAVVGFLFLPKLVFGAPLDLKLGFNQKIFYYHVPAAMIMFASVFVSGIASIAYLRTRDPAWDDVAVVGAGLVVLFGALVLTSGPVWGKAAWRHYWVWDARLIQALLLWMIFIGYGLLRRYGGLGADRFSAGLAIFGMVDVPLVYFAVNFWKTQHPNNSVVPSLQGGMRSAFWWGALAYVCLYVVLFAASLAVTRGRRRLEASENLAVDLGLLES